MKLTITQLISILLVFLVSFSCLFRYTIVPASSGGEGVNGLAYKLDRWTGGVEVIYVNGTSIEVTRRKE